MNILSISDLLSFGTVEKELVKKPVTWTSKKDKIERTMDVFVVANVSFETADKIFGVSDRKDPTTQMVRVVTERIRFGKDGSELLTKEQASGLDPHLGFALLQVVLDFDKEHAPEEEADAAKE